MIEDENPDMCSAQSSKGFEASVSPENEALTIYHDRSIFAELAKTCLELPPLLSVWFT